MEQPSNDSTDANIADAEAPEVGADPFPELTPDEFPRDRYEPVSIIGRGTVGTVYLCLDRRLHRKKVAVKVMKAFSSKDMVAFQQEARATSRLSHRNIIAVYDFGATASGAAYMAMEYVEGVSIDRLLRAEGPLNVERALKIGAYVADALAYAHGCGIFHRDIKTSNILLVHSDSREPDVRLIDFGVAAIQHTSEEAIKVQGRTIVGTPQYMSPDQCFNLAYDERSEVYSLGCVMFEMLTGKPPFQGDTALAIIQKHANEAPPTLAFSHGMQNFTNRIEALIARCLAKDREGRYQSMHHLKVDLMRVVDRAYSMTLDNMVVTDAQKNKHDRDPMLTAIMIALICFSAASWLAYMQVEKILVKNQSSVVAPPQRKVDLSLPSLDEYTASPGFVRTYNYGRLVMQANHTINDEDLKSLSTERDLDELKLLAPELNGSGFRYLAPAKLARLIIKKGKLSDSCLKNLVELKDLKSIELLDCEGVTNAGIESLSALPLEHLSVPSCKLSNEALKSIVQFKNLRNVDFAGNRKIDAATLAQFASNPNMRTLSLSTEQLDARCYDKLASIKTLQTLFLSGDQQIAATELMKLRDLPELTRISFSGNCISPETLKLVLQFPLVNRVELSGLSFGDGHMAALAGGNLRQIGLENTGVTEKGMAHILTLPKLQRVTLKQCSQVPLSSVTELSKKLKTCDIVVL